MLWVSITAHDPLARLVVLTDALTDMSGLPPGVAYHRYELDLHRIMYERMRVQTAWLAQSDFRRPMVLIDTDTLVTGELAPLFAQDFDLGFTWRRNDDMPVNGGVIFVNTRRPEASRKAFADILAIYRDRYLEVEDWFGDQYAIQAFLGVTCSEIYAATTLSCGEAVIMLFPCSRYNYSPRTLPMNVGRPEDALIYHFKGNSRIQMRPFFEINFPAKRGNRLFDLLTVARANLGHFVDLLGVIGAIRRGRKHFDENVSGAVAWIDRAEIACDFLGVIAAAGPVSTLWDSGAGPRFERVLVRRGFGLRYLAPSEGGEAADVAMALEHEDGVALLDRLKGGGLAPSWLIVAQDLTRSDGQAFESRLADAGYAAIRNRKSLNERATLWLFRKEGTA